MFLVVTGRVNYFSVHILLRLGIDYVAIASSWFWCQCPILRTAIEIFTLIVDSTVMTLSTLHDEAVILLISFGLIILHTLINVYSKRPFI